MRDSRETFRHLYTGQKRRGTDGRRGNIYAYRKIFGLKGAKKWDRWTVYVITNPEVSPTELSYLL